MGLALKGVPIWVYTKEQGTNKNLAPAQIIEGDLGKPFRLQPQTINDYVIDHIDGSLEGFFTDQLQRVTIYYRQGNVAQIEALTNYQVEIQSPTPTYANPDLNSMLSESLTIGTWPVIKRLSTTKGLFWHQLGDSRWILYDRKLMTIKKGAQANDQILTNQVPFKATTSNKFEHYDWDPQPLQKRGRLFASNQTKQVPVYSKPYGSHKNVLMAGLDVLLTQIVHDPSKNDWYEIGSQGWIEGDNVVLLENEEGEIDMTEPLFLTPVLHEKIWGGTALKDVFDLPIPSDTTGEAWIISGHQNGVSPISRGPLAGKTLAEVWQTHPELFENNDVNRPYPLLVKFLDAHQDLSVQVHPGDDYAAEHNNGELGKTESWYILAAKPGAEIYYGHKAQTQAEFNQMIDQADWEHLLQKVPVHAGDFFYVPSGTLHALGTGVLAIETQQSSDVTYRVYDFDRPDKKTGELRDLHLEDAKNVTTVPFKAESPAQRTLQMGALQETTMVEAPYFNVYKDELDGEAYIVKQAPYAQYTVIAGSGTVIVDGQSYPLELATSFVMPATVAEWTLKGKMTLIMSTPGPKSR